MFELILICFFLVANSTLQSARIGAYTSVYVTHTIILIYDRQIIILFFNGSTLLKYHILLSVAIQ